MSSKTCNVGGSDSVGGVLDFVLTSAVHSDVSVHQYSESVTVHLHVNMPEVLLAGLAPAPYCLMYMSTEEIMTYNLTSNIGENCAPSVVTGQKLCCPCLYVNTANGLSECLYPGHSFPTDIFSVTKNCCVVYVDVKLKHIEKITF